MLLPSSSHLLTFLGVLSLWGPDHITSIPPSEIQRKKVTLPGDVMIGALFSVHLTPGPKQAQTRTCGDVREQYGIQRVEAAFQAVDAINNDNTVLPNIKLGIEIRDSCWYSPIALEQSIEFIRDAIASNEDVTNSSALGDGSEASCPKSTKHAKNMIGVIGPGSSAVTIQVQNLLQLFNIPQIGYSATSRDLSQKNFFKYFLRVVPSDFHQAKVLVDLVKRHNWTYISAVHTDGNYGSSGIDAFNKLATEAGICIATSDSVLSNAEDKVFDAIITNLKKFPNAHVVICFCEGMTVKGLLRAAKRQNATGNFLFIGSDGWSDRGDVVENIEKEAVGGISVRIYSPYVKSFDQYYFNLKPSTNIRNPWFKEFWEHKFNCSLPQRKRKSEKYNKTCTGNESLSYKYKQDTKMAFVKKAIYTMAYGLHNMQRVYCPNSDGLCPSMLPINGSILLQYLNNVSFTWGNESVYFDENGDPPGRYDIMNFQHVNGSYDYVLVGTWNNGNLTITHEIQWGNKLTGGGTPESACSKPCARGQMKSIQSGSVKCCWVCVQCRENEFLRDEYTCEPCPLGWWPDENVTDCFKIPIEYIHYSDTTAIVAMTIACLGFLATVFVMVVFIRHNNTPVVKSSTRELCYVIMVGMYLCHGTTFPLLARPTRSTCFLTRVLPGFSFSMIYAALVTKTWRTVRILAGSKKKIITRKPRFMSSMAQVVITWLLIAVEVGIITAMLLLEPADSKYAYPTLNRVILICNTTSLGVIAPLGFDFFLIAMCTLYAVKTRNVPENFNEAKFIGFTMYTTLVIWLAFIPIYFGSDSKVITMCLSVSFSAIVALVLLFGPKVYIIIFRPEKNNRSAFTTAKDVRCHIGFVNPGISRNSSHSTSDFSVESPRNQSLTVQPLHSKGSNSLNLFHRFRIRKRDKLAANIAQRIRAIREAEALDRRTNVRRIESSPFPPGIGKLPAMRSSSGGDDNSIDGQDKKRLVGILREAYGTDEKDSDSYQSKHLTGKPEKCIQTSDDLLEPLLSILRQRFVRSDTLMSMLSPEDDAGRDTNYTIGWREQLNNTDRCHISVIYPFNELYPEDRTTVNRLPANEIYLKRSNDLSSSVECLYSQIKPGDIKDRVASSMSRSEDSVAEAKSSIMEESASSGSEGSCGSAVYKTIIINLGTPGLSISQDAVNGKRNSSSLHCLHTAADRLQHRPAGHCFSVGMDGKTSDDMHSSIRWRHCSRGDVITTRSHEDNLNG